MSTTQRCRPRPRIVCFGGAAVDRQYRAPGPLRAGTSNPVTRREAFGGVARNVAANLCLLGVATALVSIVGDDPNGRALIRDLEARGIDPRGVAVSPAHPTAEYLALLGPDGDLAYGIADMAILDAITADHAARFWPRPGSADWVFLDCNLPAPVLAALFALRPGTGARLAVDAVSVGKAQRLPADLSPIDLLVLNADEGEALLGTAGCGPERIVSSLRARGAGRVIVTLGADGLVIGEGTGAPVACLAVPAKVADVTGAGDCLIAATLARLVAGDDLMAAARVGALAAALTVEHDGGVRADLSPALLAGASWRLAAVQASSRTDP